MNKEVSVSKICHCHAISLLLSKYILEILSLLSKKSPLSKRSILITMYNEN